MNDQDPYTLGKAFGASVRIDGNQWTLVQVRELRHPREKVWRALTEPWQLREWAPFDVDKPIDAAGTTISLTTVGAPTPMTSREQVIQADPPAILEYTWGGKTMRWELQDTGNGTRLTLWANIERPFIAMGASGWHICLDVLDRLLAEKPIGRIVGLAAMRLEGWQRLMAEYAGHFGVEVPHWNPKPGGQA